MKSGRSLFDDITAEETELITAVSNKEASPLDILQGLDEDKIASAIGKVRVLKQEKTLLESRVRELESLLAQKEAEVENLQIEKTDIKNQIEGLLAELDSIELN